MKTTITYKPRTLLMTDVEFVKNVAQPCVARAWQQCNDRVRFALRDILARMTRNARRQS